MDHAQRHLNESQKTKGDSLVPDRKNPRGRFLFTFSTQALDMMDLPTHTSDTAYPLVGHKQLIRTVHSNYVIKR